MGWVIFVINLIGMYKPSALNGEKNYLVTVLDFNPVFPNTNDNINMMRGLSSERYTNLE